jgi:rod shape determining protein RodA
MNNQDFIRQSDGLDSQSRDTQTIWRTIHTDPPLLVGISVLCGFGLFVLFSASGGDVPVVRRQGLTMVVGFVVMIIVAQFNVDRASRISAGGWSRGKRGKELAGFTRPA